MRLLTASKTELAASCPPSHAGMDWFGDDESSEAAMRGTGIHLALEKLPEIGLEAALALIPAKWHQAVRSAAASPGLAELLEPNAALREVALQWHPATDTARGLSIGQGRNYADASPGAVVGTADILAIRMDHVLVADLKSGQPVTEIRRNMQMRFLALAACRAYEKDRAIVQLIYVREDSDAWIESTEFDALDLAEIADQFRDVLAKIDAIAKGAPATYTRGDYCGYCPAKPGCPAWVSLARWVTKDLPAFRAEMGAAISTGALQAAYVMAEDAKAAIGMLQQEIKRLAAGTPIPLAGGKWLGLATGKETVKDAEKVHEILTRELGPEAAELAITVETTTSTTKGQIEKAFKAAKVPPKKRPDLWAALRQAGALATSTYVRECDADELVGQPVIDVEAKEVP